MGKLSKILNTSKSKKFWAYIVVGALFLLAGIVLCSPLWTDVFNLTKEKLFFAEWGNSIVKLVISIILILYICLFLVKRIRGNGVVKTLSIIEMVLLGLVALGGILSQFDILKISDASVILGFAMWLRGVIELFRAYYYHANENQAKYPLSMLVISILLVSFGVYFMTSNIISNKTILLILVAVILIIGIVLLTLGFIKKPQSTKVKKEKVKKEKSPKTKKAKTKKTETENE